jgi:hypothetical protein
MKYNDQAVPLSITQQAQIKQYGDAKQYAAMYRYIADEIKTGHIHVIGDSNSNQYYWFDQAARINAGDTQSPAFFFIRAATRYGLAIDGKPTTAAYIQKISDNIGAKVYEDLKGKQALPAFSKQFNRDISTSTNEGGMTIGGWGGAFYFWRETYIDPKTREVTTVGDYILSHPAELEKFLSVNSKAIADTVIHFNVDLASDPAFIEAVLGGFRNFTDSIASAQVGARLVIAINQEYIRRGEIYAQQSFQAAIAKINLQFTALAGTTDKLFDTLISDLQKQFGLAEQTTSPLIIDLDGNGVQTLSLKSGLHFDHDGNHFAELSGWAAAGEALVVRDLNGDGKIDRGAELFGNHTLLKNGNKADNGFIALAEYDTNQDGRVDVNEAARARIQLWRDKNSNAQVDTGELMDFAQAGVASLTTRYTEKNHTDAQGNQHRQIGHYTRSDGSTHALEDIWFAEDTARTLATKLVNVDATIAALPNLRGLGNVHSLHQAMARDVILKSKVQQFIATKNPEARSVLLNDLIYRWTGVHGIDPTSRRTNKMYGNVIGDARKLACLEALMGKTYSGTWCSGERDTNPHGHAAPILLKAYDKLAQWVNMQLISQAIYKPYYDSLTLKWNPSKQALEIDASSLIKKLQAQYNIDSQGTSRQLREFSSMLHHQAEIGKQILTELQAQGDLNRQGLVFDLATIGYHYLGGTTGSDTLRVKTSDMQYVIDGGAGNDTLHAGNKDDLLVGGKGNDTLYLGCGANTVLYNLGDGQDTIHEVSRYVKQDSVNRDVLRLGAGISANTTQVVRGVGYYDNYDLTLVFNGHDRVVLKEYFDADHRLATIQFADGTQWDATTIIKRFGYHGTAGNDTLRACMLDETLAGGKGNDTFYLGRGTNTVLYNLGDG